MKEQSINVFWFRRDLRITDNPGFYRALTSGKPVLPVFIFDTGILSDLEDDDSRVTFILKQVQMLHDLFEENGSSFWIYHGKPLDAFKLLNTEYTIDTVFANQDYEPDAVSRDNGISVFLASGGSRLQLCKDHVIFHQDDVLNGQKKPYTIFTPYSKKWKEKLTDDDLQPYPSEKYLSNLLRMEPLKKYHHADLGFRPGRFPVPGLTIDTVLIAEYGEKRDFPALDATSRLGVHLRFGTVSIRQVTTIARKHSASFLNELIWRNFYIDMLWHFPRVVRGAFKPAYDRIQWQNSEKDFARWCEGTTGYPMVDAGMRQLNQTGYMHNRLRMITAGFLCKHLLIDWRWGEAYFADKLLDYELASNNGGWQWAAGSGCDASPYFRVFNPTLQLEKFDPDKAFVRKWVPEYDTTDYPAPVVDHKMARSRAIRVYREAVSRES